MRVAAQSHKQTEIQKICFFLKNLHTRCNTRLRVFEAKRSMRVSFGGKNSVASLR
jgi:hypothetical protein